MKIKNVEDLRAHAIQLLDKLENKMDTQFHWVLGTIFTLIATIITLFGGIILHMAKLI